MAEVPYGGNGFTLLLSSVSRQRRWLAEAAQNAVPRVGSGAEGSNIFVCRDVSQADTGRQGSARLVLANVDLPQLDEQRLERLQWKLERFVDSLDDLLPDIPQVTGRDCGPVVSARLREWEEELKVAQLPAGQTLRGERAAEGAATTALPLSGWKSAACVIAMLCLLGYWILWQVEKPKEVAVEAETASAGMSTIAESEAVVGVQQSGVEPKAEQSLRIDRKIASGRRELKPLAELVREWKDQKLTAVEGVKRLDSELGRRGWRPVSEDEEQEIVNWLGGLWWQDLQSQETVSLLENWTATQRNLIELGSVADLQAFHSLKNTSPKIGNRFSRDVLRALRDVRNSRLLKNVGEIWQNPPKVSHVPQDKSGTRDKLGLTERWALDVAVQDESDKSWKQLSYEAATKALQSIENSKGIKVATQLNQLLGKLHELLQTTVIVSIKVRRKKGGIDKSFEESQQVTALELLHSETLFEEQGAEVAPGTKPGLSLRQYWRPLLTDGIKSKKIGELTTIELPDTDENAAWFKSRDELLKQFQEFDQSLHEAEQATSANTNTAVPP
jgi:hypothetical protein